MRKYTTKTTLIAMSIVILGLFFRLYHIEFGLPHSLHADEPELGEFAVKYTYEIRSIVANNDWYKLIPLNFVYGTVPTYLYTVATMGFSKTLGILNVGFGKMHIYVFLRSLTALLSLVIVPSGAFLYYKLFKNDGLRSKDQSLLLSPREDKSSRIESKKGAILTAALLALNWHLIVMGHYLNVDIITTVFLTLAFVTTLLYYEKSSDTLYTALTAVFVGLAVGTKVTAALSLPLFLYIFIAKKGYRNLFAFLFIIFGVFAVTNPFSLIFANDFAYRIYTLLVKENGLVFDSVEPNLFKYFLALNFVATPMILAISLYGKLSSLRVSKQRTFHIFLIGHVLLYLIFYSLGTRRVDRWLLPILPIVIIYAAYGIQLIQARINRYAFAIFALTILGTYLYFPSLLLTQFQRNTPKSAAYLWMRDNTLPASNKYVITEQGLDPMNKLPSATVKHVPVYENENAQYFYPESPIGYEYIVLSSRPMTNFKRERVAGEFPEYAKRWQKFEDTLQDNASYEVIKTFELSKPNLIPLSDVIVYRNLDPI